MIKTLLPLAIEAATEAGKIILKYYRKDNITSKKIDGSPLTLADQESHLKICELLEKTDYKIVSEEGDDHYIDENIYWLVDPLDGTKDYLAANDEFTVNIALIKDCKPILGVVYAPALNELYAGIVGLEAWQLKHEQKTTLNKIKKSKDTCMAVSRFHNLADTDIFAKTNNISKVVSMGSALKYVRIALGEIDVYPRLVGSSEWDTAAGQAVLEAAGGYLLDWHTKMPLRYGKSNRRNGRMIAFRVPYGRNDFILQNYKPGLL